MKARTSQRHRIRHLALRSSAVFVLALAGGVADAQGTGATQAPPPAGTVAPDAASPAAAGAQTPVDQPAAPVANAPAGQPAEGLGEIVVTASKRAENLQRAPLSITAVSAAALASRGISDPGQLTGLAPAVSFQPTFLLLTYIRGVGNYSSQPAVDQSIAYNVDGIYLDRPYAMTNLLFDLERVELLRGPQGTLQGRNSTGGSVNLITARPVMDFAARVSATGGNYGTINSEGMINVPLGENAALRISAAQNHHGAFFDNGFGDLDSQGVRVRLLARPTPRLEILLTGEYSRQKEDGPTDSPCPPGSADAACVGVRWKPFAGSVGQGTDPVNSIVEPQVLKDDNKAIYAEVNYDLDFATLTWVPNYRFYTYRSNQAYSQFFAYAPAVRDSMHSEEVRLASKAGSPFTWVGGFYYGRQHSREQNYFLTGVGPSISVNRPGFDPVGHVYFQNDVDSYTYRSTSVFGQVTVPLLFDGFRVVGGGRYTWDHKELRGNVGLVVAGPTVISVAVGAKQSLRRFTYKAGVEYDFAPQILGYANVSTGFKSGGVNGVPPGSGFPETFGPEKNMAYQAGLKGRFLDNRLQINTEGFYYDYSGYLASSFATTAEGITIGLNVNSQKARMYGGEVESSFLLTPADRLDFAVALLSAKYKTFFIPSTGLNLSGKRLQNAPGHTFNVDYTHTFRMANGGNIQAHATAHYESNQYVDYRLSPGSLVKGFWRENADITYHAPGDRWTIGGFISNISNNGSATTAVGGLGPYELAVPYPPRTFGGRVSAKF